MNKQQLLLASITVSKYMQLIKQSVLCNVLQSKNYRIVYYYSLHISRSVSKWLISLSERTRI